MTFRIRRWFHVRTAKRYGEKPHDYDEWRAIVEDFPMKRAVPAYIKNIKWHWQKTMTILEKGCIAILLAFLVVSIIVILAANV